MWRQGGPSQDACAVAARAPTRLPLGLLVPRLSCDHLASRYQPPNLAISTLYWKAWPLLLVVAAFNPENIGERPLPRLGQPRPPEPLWASPLRDVPLVGPGAEPGWGPGSGPGPAPPVALCPRPGRLGRVPHTEDADGDGDDQVSRSPHAGLGRRARLHSGLCRGPRPSGPRRVPVVSEVGVGLGACAGPPGPAPGVSHGPPAHMPLWVRGPDACQPALEAPVCSCVEGEGGRLWALRDIRSLTEV